MIASRDDHLLIQIVIEVRVIKVNSDTNLIHGFASTV